MQGKVTKLICQLVGEGGQGGGGGTGIMLCVHV